MSEAVVQVTARHLCAGIVLIDDVVTEAAPILRWTIGKTRAELRNVFANKGWSAKVLTGSRFGNVSN